MTFVCLISPEPTISWRAPKSVHHHGRYEMDLNDTELTIYNITASDEAIYYCNSSNAQGYYAQRFQLRVEGQTLSDEKFGIYGMVFIYRLMSLLEFKVKSLQIGAVLNVY